jgi:hypothetical protein
MRGQWLGNYAGTNNGSLNVEVDDVGSYLQVAAYAYDQDHSMPVLASHFQAPKNEAAFNLQIPLRPIDRETGSILNADSLSKQYPNITCPAAPKQNGR